MENRSNNLLVGSITLFLMIALAASIIWLANSGSANRKEYDIFFKQSVDGISKGSGVQFSGVPSGQVKEVALWQPDPQFVRVRIEVNNDVPVLQGTIASIQGVGFTGVSQIQLDGAMKGAPPITQNGPAGVPVIPAKLAGLGELLNNAPQLLARISTLTERLTELADDRNARSLAHILQNVDTLTATLARDAPQLGQTLADARVAVRQAGDAADKVGALAASTQGLVSEDARPLVADLRRTVATATRTLETLEATINDARPGMQQFSQRTIPEANALIRDLRRSASTLANVTDRLDQQGAAAILGPSLPDFEPHN